MSDKKLDWNSNQMDWVYWSNLSSISSKDVCWLVCEVDPNICNNDSVESKYNLSDEKRIKIQKAITQIESDIRAGKEQEHNTPWHWVCWAKSKGITVPDQFHELAYKANLKNIHCHTAQPLEEINNELMAWYMKQDSWKYYEAIFLIQGFKPPGDIDGFDEVRAHFPDVYQMLQRSITIGSIGEEIKQAGQKNFIDTPERWLEWGESKGLVVDNDLKALSFKNLIQRQNCKSVQETIPGKQPSTAMGKLAVKAAWEIERETGKRATKNEVMKQLQTWADNGEYPETLLSSDKINKSVIWITNKCEKRKYSLEACGKILATWYKSRKPDGN